MHNNLYADRDFILISKNGQPASQPTLIIRYRSPFLSYITFCPKEKSNLLLIGIIMNCVYDFGFVSGPFWNAMILSIKFYS